VAPNGCRVGNEVRAGRALKAPADDRTYRNQYPTTAI
ncbi:uncharacterized protein METZ01_LOCUS257221, partial [marine metagenome]